MIENGKFAADNDNESVDPLLDFGEASTNGAIDAVDADEPAPGLTGTGAYGELDWLSAPLPISPTLDTSSAAAEMAVAAAPSITGTSSTTRFIETGQKDHPFATVTITDPNAGAIDTISIWVDEFAVEGPFLGVNGSAQGALSGAGVSHQPGGLYTLSGSAATVTRELRELVWSPGSSYATLTQTKFTIQLQSNEYNQSETDQNTNFVDDSTVTSLSISNMVGNGSLTTSVGTGDWIPIPTSIIKYYFESLTQGPSVYNITPFYTDNGKNAYLCVTWMIYPQNIGCPVQILEYDATTKSFVDVTTKFFGSKAPNVVESNGMVVADFNGDGQPDFFFPCWGPDAQPIFPRDQLWLSTASGKYVNASSALPAIASGNWTASSAVVNKQGGIGIIAGGRGPNYYSKITFLYLIDNGGKITNATHTFEPIFPSGSIANGSSSPYLADVNGDGLADLIYPITTNAGPYKVGEHSLQVELFLNPGNGDFSQAKPILLPNVPIADGPNTGGQVNPPQVTDVVSFKDWSGKFDDLVVISNSASEEGYAIQILMNNGADHFTDETATRLLGARSSDLAKSTELFNVWTADLNGKGPSIITQGRYYYQPGTDGSYSQVFLNNGKDVFTLAYSLAANPADQPWNRYRGMEIYGVEDIGGTETLILDNGGAAISFVPYEPPPELEHSTTNKTIKGSEKFSFTLASDTFVDPKGLAMTYHASGWDFSGMPDWLKFNGSTMTFSGTAPASVGVFDVTVTAYDPYGWLAEDNFKISVVAGPAVPPPVVEHPIADVNEIVARIFKLVLPGNVFSDPKGLALTYSASGPDSTALPSWLTFNSATETFSATGAPPAGSYAVTVTARGPGGLARDTFNIRVTGAVPNDFTGDAVSDVLWVNPKTRLYSDWIVKNGKVATTNLYNPGPPPVGDTFIATGDLDGFGDADLLYQNSTTGALDFWGTYGGVASGVGKLAGEAPATGWNLVGVADIDVPTSTDFEPCALLWVDAKTGKAMEQVVVNDAIAATYTLADPGAEWSVLGTGDFSGTTAVDILFQNQKTGDLQDWRIDNGALAEDTTFAGPGAGWSYVGAGDFLEGLGDEDDSLLFANAAGKLKLYNLDDGASTGYAALSAPTVPKGFSVAAIGDFNGDGISDVLIYDETTGAVDVGLVNASGEIAAWSSLGVANPATLKLVVARRYEPPPVVEHPIADVNEIVQRGFTLTLPRNVFSDPKGLALTYSASGPDSTLLPTWLTFDAATETFTGTGAPPAGSYAITVTAQDPYGNLTEDTFTIRVTGAVPDDFTGDAVSDILWLNPKTGLYSEWILKNGAVATAGLFNPGPPPVGDEFLATGDLDGFGSANPLFQNSTTGALMSWNTKDGVANGAATFAGEPPSTGWSLAGVADIDVPTPQTNWLEPCALLWVDAKTGKAMEQVVVNDAVTATYTLTDPGAGWTALGTGDFSGTTAVDILFQNQKTGELQDWRINNGAVAEDKTFAGPGVGWSYVGAGDFLEGLGDEDDSLLFANAAGKLKLYNLDDGASTGYAALSAPTVPKGFSVAAIGDFNGDGISDVLIYDKTTGAVDVGLVNASGEIAAWHTLGVANPATLKFVS